MRKHPEFPTEMHKRQTLFMSKFAMEIYTVLVLFILIRKSWILHGISVVLLAHIGDILFSWFLHVKEAREILQFKSWLLWWIRIGLDVATGTVEGHILHRLVLANTLNFWNWFGIRYTMNWFDDIANTGRAKFLNQAKEQLSQLSMNYDTWKTGNMFGFSLEGRSK